MATLDEVRNASGHLCAADNSEVVRAMGERERGKEGEGGGGTDISVETALKTHFRTSWGPPKRGPEKAREKRREKRRENP